MPNPITGQSPSRLTNVNESSNPGESSHTQQNYTASNETDVVQFGEGKSVDTRDVKMPSGNTGEPSELSESIKADHKHQEKDMQDIFLACCDQINGFAYLKNILNVKEHLVNATDKEGKTALHYATEQGNFDVAALLIKKNANVNVKDNSGKTAFHYAAEQGNDNFVELLLGKKANVNVKDNNGKTALHLSAADGNLHFVKRLIDLKPLIYDNVDMNATDNEGKTALYFANLNRHYDVVRILIQAGASV